MKRLRNYLLYAVIALAVAAYTLFYYIPQHKIHVPELGEAVMYSIDVGQGDSTLFVMPDGRTMLIDAGNAGDYSKIKAVMDKVHVNKIDFLILSHPHSDHMGSMAQIIESYEIGKLYMPDAASDTAEFYELIEAAENKGISPETVSYPYTLCDGDYNISVLSPRDKDYADENLFSVVVRVEYGDTAFMIMGDAEAENEDDMLQDKDLELSADVIRIGHHGSDGSSTKKFIGAVSPKYAVISVGKDNTYGHPSSEVTGTLAEVGADILRTDVNGTVCFSSDGEKIKVFCEK